MHSFFHDQFYSYCSKIRTLIRNVIDKIFRILKIRLFAIHIFTISFVCSFLCHFFSSFVRIYPMMCNTSLVLTVLRKFDLISIDFNENGIYFVVVELIIVVSQKARWRKNAASMLIRTQWWKRQNSLICRKVWACLMCTHFQNGQRTVITALFGMTLSIPIEKCNKTMTVIFNRWRFHSIDQFD